MSKVQVFDPPMCCSTGVCGPEVDPSLVRFAADLEWLKTKDVEVERFNLSQDPAPFVGNPVVARAMRGGDDALPLLLVDGKIAAHGRYPAREALAALVGIEAPKTVYTEVGQELVAIGAAIASNREPCFRFHYDKARKLGVSKDDMARAVATARMVKEAPARAREAAHPVRGHGEGTLGRDPHHDGAGDAPRALRAVRGSADERGT